MDHSLDDRVTSKRVTVGTEHVPSMCRLMSGYLFPAVAFNDSCFCLTLLSVRAYWVTGILLHIFPRLEIFYRLNRMY